ncbi:MAG TPA: polymer-forming cytoskeletal family protein [Sedimenticola thiotaurini]|uniref:Polymer-forming cytoskeletal family protein n=1 Tax=Sedimenticola thiotaurini TaxID=1543721 RepID=A0A831WA90_9GAMM|nr:polymer-forming cytoskeletal family protein [Sedimenticola thiotaurini]
MAWRKRFKPPKIATVIGTGTVLDGDLRFTGGIHVDGAIHGSVLAEQDERSTLILSREGSIEGDVRVPNVILDGKVVGDVYASRRVELLPNARVTGTLYYPLLEMAMGAEVNGQLIYTEDVEQRLLDYDGSSHREETAVPGDVVDEAVEGNS